MHIRLLEPGDIPAAALLRGAARAYILHESTPEQAAAFLAEQGEEGMRGRVAGDYVFHVAEMDEDGRRVLAGFIALRQRSHVYSLYVDRQWQRRGIARRLWERARDAALGPGHPGAFTVNASNHALPFYASIGFVPTAPTQDGIVPYNPMRLVLAGAFVGPA